MRFIAGVLLTVITVIAVASIFIEVMFWVLGKLLSV